MPVTPFIIGTLPQSIASGGDLTTLNTSAIRLAFSWQQQGNKTITNISAYIHAVLGTDSLRKISCNICADVTGVPATVLASIEKIGGFSTGVATWSGFSLPVNHGIKYWLVFYCTSVTPANDTVSMRWMYNGLQTITNSYAGIKRASTDGGATYATGQAGQEHFQVTYSDDSVNQQMSIAAAIDSSLIFGTTETGLQLITPSTNYLNVIGAVIVSTKGGTPTDRVLRLYNCSNGLISESMPINPNSMNNQAQGIFALFPNNVTIAPDTMVRIAYADKGGVDSSANYSRCYTTSINNTPRDVAMSPYRMAKITRASTATDFTVTPTAILHGGLLLDQYCPFLPAPLNRRQFNSMR